MTPTNPVKPISPTNPRRRRTLIIIASVLTSVAAVAAVAVWQVSAKPWLLWDEWHCSSGEFPVSFAEGGSACYGPDDTLPAGAVPDPLGNRPFDCANRSGWRQIERNGEGDCLKSGLALPSGFSFVD